MVDEEKLHDDLIDIAAWCQFKFPAEQISVLFVATQLTPEPDQLVIAVADMLTSAAFTGPIVTEARRGLEAMGYSFKWDDGGGIDTVFEVKIQRLSNHLKMEAVQRLQGLGL